MCVSSKIWKFQIIFISVHNQVGFMFNLIIVKVFYSYANSCFVFEIGSPDNAGFIESLFFFVHHNFIKILFWSAVIINSIQCNSMLVPSYHSKSCNIKIFTFRILVIHECYCTIIIALYHFTVIIVKSSFHITYISMTMLLHSKVLSVFCKNY